MTEIGIDDNLTFSSVKNLIRKIEEKTEGVMKMKVLRVVIEKTNLFHKTEQIIAHISLDSTKGAIIIQIPDQKLETELRKYISFSSDYIKAQAIPQETSIIGQIQTSLMGRKLDGNAVVVDISVQKY